MKKINIRIGVLIVAFLIISVYYFSPDLHHISEKSALNIEAADYDAAAGAHVIGEYATKYNAKSARAANIRLASEAINRIVVNPGEEFSFNNAVGPTTEKNGFKKAKIFIKGKESEGFGGGVCQVSSTLYNAVESAGLEVLERHPHSKEVRYVPQDRDAATSYGSIDFRFKNNAKSPVEILSTCEKNRVVVKIVKM